MLIPFVQISVINLITYYAPFIFEESVGVSKHLSGLLSGFLGIAFFVSSLVPIWIIDKLGRRVLMLFAVIGQGCCMAILAGTTSPEAQNNTAALVVAVVALFTFQFIFTAGYSGLTFLYAAELAPLQVRAAVSACS